MVRIWIVLLCLYPVELSWSSEVIFVSRSGTYIALTPTSAPAWTVNDTLCLTRSRRKTACGHIFEVLERGALAHLTAVREKPRFGDSAIRSEIDSELQRYAARNPSSLSEDELSVQQLALGLTLSNPLLHYERLLFAEMAAGFTITTMNSTLYSLPESGYGLQATLTYYPKREFQSIWVQVSPGLFLTTVEGGSLVEASLQVTTGWRWLWKGFSFGTGIGAQYFYALPNSIFSDSHQFLLPVFQVDIGLML